MSAATADRVATGLRRAATSLVDSPRRRPSEGAGAAARRARRRAACRRIGALALAWSALCGHAQPAARRTLAFTGGRLYGPARLGEQRVPGAPPGPIYVRTRAGAGLDASVPLFNNGELPPNLSTAGAAPGARLSDGSTVNEQFDLGRVAVMRGTLGLVQAAVSGGAAEGDVYFSLDDDRNWTFSIDLALDPGFDWGVIRLADLHWSTAPRRLPMSRQSAEGQPAGVDGAGSLASGDTVPGLLGDDDGDGHLDGVFNAVGFFPATSWLTPGAPFAQTRAFVSDIEVTPLDAAGLTLANALAYVALLDDDARRAPALRATAVRRLELAAFHLARALRDGPRREGLRAGYALVRRSAAALARGAAAAAVDQGRLRVLVPVLLGESR